jgi:4-alpha-glucanotransferase
LGNATAVNTAGMASRDEILDILLIANNNGRLSNVQLLCLEDELKRNDFAQSNFPYNIYAPFNWENLILTNLHASMNYGLKRLIFYAFNVVYKSQTK